MMRKVMVLAIACLIPNRAGAAGGAARSCRFMRTPLDAFLGALRRRAVGPNSGRRPRCTYLGASTTAPPIKMPGINAASNKAAPASTDSPTVTYAFMASSSGGGSTHQSVMDGRGDANSDAGRVREIDRSLFGVLFRPQARTSQLVVDRTSARPAPILASS